MKRIKLEFSVNRKHPCPTDPTILSIIQTDEFVSGKGVGTFMATIINLPE